MNTPTVSPSGAGSCRVIERDRRLRAARRSCCSLATTVQARGAPGHAASVAASRVASETGRPAQARQVPLSGAPRQPAVCQRGGHRGLGHRSVLRGCHYRIRRRQDHQRQRGQGRQGNLERVTEAWMRGKQIGIAARQAAPNESLGRLEGRAWIYAWEYRSPAGSTPAPLSSSAGGRA